MKNAYVFLTFSMILALSIVFIMNSHALDTSDDLEDLDLFEISYFINESIKKETLLGYGSSSSGGEHLNTLKDKIDNAAYALEYSTFDEACQLLLDAYLNTDGLKETPDIVYGQAAPKLAKMIDYMRTDIIGCE